MPLHVEEGRLLVTRPGRHPGPRAMHGLTRALLANMVTGVADGFRKTLELVGVGYRAQIQGPTLVLALGYTKQNLWVQCVCNYYIINLCHFDEDCNDKELVGQ